MFSTSTTIIRVIVISLCTVRTARGLKTGRAVTLHLEPVSGGLVRADLGPCPSVPEALGPGPPPECASLPGSQLMPLLLDQGPGINPALCKGRPEGVQHSRGLLTIQFQSWGTKPRFLIPSPDSNLLTSHRLSCKCQQLGGKRLWS